MLPAVPFSHPGVYLHRQIRAICLAVGNRVTVKHLASFTSQQLKVLKQILQSNLPVSGALLTNFKPRAYEWPFAFR